METKSYILVKNKKHEYSIIKASNKTTKLICKDANINQEFLNEDITQIILDLPNLIISEQDYSKKNSLIQFRVSAQDKKRIEKNAIKKGYANVSSYIKDIALTR